MLQCNILTHAAMQRKPRPLRPLRRTALALAPAPPRGGFFGGADLRGESRRFGSMRRQFGRGIETGQALARPNMTFGLRRLRAIERARGDAEIDNVENPRVVRDLRVATRAKTAADIRRSSDLSQAPGEQRKIGRRDFEPNHNRRARHAAATFAMAKHRPPRARAVAANLESRRAAQTTAAQRPPAPRRRRGLAAASINA